MIHDTAQVSGLAHVDDSAHIGADVVVEPFAFIGPDVHLGAGTWVGPNSTIVVQHQNWPEIANYFPVAQ